MGDLAGASVSGLLPHYLAALCHSFVEKVQETQGPERKRASETAELQRHYSRQSGNVLVLEVRELDVLY